METTTKQFIRVSYDREKTHLTATEKRSILALVNANNPDYFGKWMKANRINIMVTPISENEFEVSFKLHHKYGLLGSHDTIHTTTAKLS